MKNPIIKSSSSTMFIDVDTITEIAPGLKFSSGHQVIVYHDKDGEMMIDSIEFMNEYWVSFNGKKHEFTSSYENKVKYGEYKTMFDSLEKVFNVNMVMISCQKLGASIERMGIKAFVNEHSKFQIK